MKNKEKKEEKKERKRRISDAMFSSVIQWEEKINKKMCLYVKIKIAPMKKNHLDACHRYITDKGDLSATDRLLQSAKDVYFECRM